MDIGYNTKDDKNIPIPRNVKPMLNQLFYTVFYYEKNKKDFHFYFVLFLL